MDPNETKSKLLCKEFMGRINAVYQEGRISDCSFLVGQQPDQKLFSANKTILAVASEVFETMLYGSLAENNEDPISVPDISPANFKILLSYIYTDEITITCIKHAGELYYIAMKYMLLHLQKKCSEYFIEKLDHSNACSVYEYGQILDDGAVRDKATDVMSRDTKQVLQDPNFVKIKLSTLVHLFSLDTLSIESEMDLLEAAVRYKEAQAQETSQNYSDDKAKLSIQDAITKIRFLTVSSKKFADCKVKEIFLSGPDILAILLNITSPDADHPYPEQLCHSRISRVGKVTVHNAKVGNGNLTNGNTTSTGLFSSPHFGGFRTVL